MCLRGFCVEKQHDDELLMDMGKRGPVVPDTSLRILVPASRTGSIIGKVSRNSGMVVLGVWVNGKWDKLKRQNTSCLGNCGEGLILWFRVESTFSP